MTGLHSTTVDASDTLVLPEQELNQNGYRFGNSNLFKKIKTIGVSRQGTFPRAQPMNTPAGSLEQKLNSLNHPAASAQAVHHPSGGQARKKDLHPYLPKSEQVQIAKHIGSHTSSVSFISRPDRELEIADIIAIKQKKIPKHKHARSILEKLFRVKPYCGALDSWVEPLNLKVHELEMRKESKQFPKRLLLVKADKTNNPKINPLNLFPLATEGFFTPFQLPNNKSHGLFLIGSDRMITKRPCVSKFKNAMKVLLNNHVEPFGPEIITKTKDGWRGVFGFPYSVDKGAILPMNGGDQLDPFSVDVAISAKYFIAGFEFSNGELKSTSHISVLSDSDVSHLRELVNWSLSPKDNSWALKSIEDKGSDF